MPIRHISKPSVQATNDWWRMTYCGTSVTVTKCIALSMYMKGFFENVQYKKGTVDMFYPCTKCLENIDGLDVLKHIP